MLRRSRAAWRLEAPPPCRAGTAGVARVAPAVAALAGVTGLAGGPLMAWACTVLNGRAKRVLSWSPCASQGPVVMPCSLRTPPPCLWLLPPLVPGPHRLWPRLAFVPLTVAVAAVALHQAWQRMEQRAAQQANAQGKRAEWAPTQQATQHPLLCSVPRPRGPLTGRLALAGAFSAARDALRGARPWPRRAACCRGGSSWGWRRRLLARLPHVLGLDALIAHHLPCRRAPHRGKVRRGREEAE